MNRQIIQLFAVIVVAFGVLVGFTSYWSVFDAESLELETANKRPLFESQQIRRGRIVTSDGVLIARSVAVGRGTNLQYVRRYPTADLFGHPIGYSFIDKGNSEFERFHNDELVGEGNEIESIIDEIGGGVEAGNDIVTSLDSSAQQTALDQLAGRPGAVVALDPRTGKVLALAGYPGYDPNDIPTQLGELNADPASPLVDRPTQGTYPPGSTFKVVTATAAIDSGEASPDTTIDSPATIDIQGTPLANSGGAEFGVIDMRTALTNSVNTYFAQLGEQIGTDTLYEYMDRFGFNQKPQIDLPDNQLSTSGVFDLESEEFLGNDDPVDVGRIAIGQERLLATPLQMAEVAAAVANGGRLMRPTIWSRVKDPDGRVIERMEPSEQSEVMSEETAATMTEMMTSVVEEGTGTAAALSGIDVAGKTGTAEVPGREECAVQGLPNQAWFIGFAPVDDPQVAVAATVECTDGQGGTVAAPIAAAVMQDILGG